MLTPTCRRMSSTLNGSWISLRSRAARSSASSSPASGSRTANSSPPSRARTSPGRSAGCRRGPTWRSSWSPAWWPRLSLTSLKPSRSSSSSAAGRRAVAVVSTRAVSSSRARRLARPVSSSVRACCLTSLKARTSRNVTAVRARAARTHPMASHAADDRQLVAPAHGEDDAGWPRCRPGAGPAGASPSGTAPSWSGSTAAGCVPGAVRGARRPGRCPASQISSRGPPST